MRRFSEIFLFLLLNACVSEGQYQEVRTVQLGNSANQIIETTQGSYRQLGGYPVVGHAYIHTPNVSATFVQPPIMSADSPVLYPEENTVIYQSGNTSIKRGTVYPTACSHQIVRHGRTEVYAVPCYP